MDLNAKHGVSAKASSATDFFSIVNSTKSKYSHVSLYIHYGHDRPKISSG
jgi:hypothetical protein